MKKDEYTNRINRVIDYIESNLEQELTLKKLAGIANFSTYHFHRIFSANVGEPLNQFMQRLRLEKAAGRLLGDQGESITKIAYDCGFSSSSSFARAFKDYFSVSASKWRKEKLEQKSKNGIMESKNGIMESKNGIMESKNGIMESKIGQTESKQGEDIMENSVTMKGKNQVTRKNIMTNSEFKEPLSIEVKELSPLNVAYVRHIGNFKDAPDLFKNMFTKIIHWAGARSLLNFPETKVMAVYHDNPEITEEDKMRTSLCVTVPENTEVEGEIGKMTLKGGRYAIAHFELRNGEEFKAAWNGIYGNWLPQSGFQPDDGPPFEVYLNNPAEHPEHLEIVDIYLPVKPM